MGLIAKLEAAGKADLASATCSCSACAELGRAIDELAEAKARVRVAGELVDRVHRLGSAIGGPRAGRRHPADDR